MVAIRLRTLADCKDFVDLVGSGKYEECTVDVYLGEQRSKVTVDGKSLLGIMSLEPNKELNITVSSFDSELATELENIIGEKFGGQENGCD